MQEQNNNLIPVENEELNNNQAETIENPPEEIKEEITKEISEENIATEENTIETEEIPEIIPEVITEEKETINYNFSDNTYREATPPPPPPPPYGFYPPFMPTPPKKKKLGTSTKVFIIILAVFYGISSFAMAGALGYSIYTANMEKAYDNYKDYYETYKEYKDYYSQFEDFFGEGENTPDDDSIPDFGGDNGNNGGNGGKFEEKEENTKGETEEYVQPNIEYSPNLDGITINDKPNTEPLSAEEVYNKVILSTVSVNAKIPLVDNSYEQSGGSGIIITEDGFIVTNSHVIGNTKSTIVSVITEDGTEYPAIIAAFDKATDLAVLKIDAEGLTPAEFGNDEELNIGEWVIAIGSPGGASFSGSLTRGVISGLDRVIDTTETSKITYIQTDAVINPGNSGGPLVNMYGQVVGINTSKIAADAYEGMGFSIPTTDAKSIIDQLLASGYVEGRVRVGITGQNNVYGNPYGVIIIEFDETGSSFDGTEAAINDIIIGMDGKTVQSLTDLTKVLQNYKAGDKAKVNLYRPSTGEEIEVEITLLPDAGETQR